MSAIGNLIRRLEKDFEGLETLSEKEQYEKRCKLIKELKESEEFIDRVELRSTLAWMYGVLLTLFTSLALPLGVVAIPFAIATGMGAAFLFVKVRKDDLDLTRIINYVEAKCKNIEPEELEKVEGELRINVVQEKSRHIPDGSRRVWNLGLFEVMHNKERGYYLRSAGNSVKVFMEKVEKLERFNEALYKRVNSTEDSGANVKEQGERVEEQSNALQPHSQAHLTSNKAREGKREEESKKQDGPKQKKEKNKRRGEGVNILKNDFTNNDNGHSERKKYSSNRVRAAQKKRVTQEKSLSASSRSSSVITVVPPPARRNKK